MVMKVMLNRYQTLDNSVSQVQNLELPNLIKIRISTSADNNLIGTVQYMSQKTFILILSKMCAKIAKPKVIYSKIVQKTKWITF